MMELTLMGVERYHKRTWVICDILIIDFRNEKSFNWITYDHMVL